MFTPCRRLSGWCALGLLAAFCAAGQDSVVPPPSSPPPAPEGAVAPAPSAPDTNQSSPGQPAVGTVPATNDRLTNSMVPAVVPTNTLPSAPLSEAQLLDQLRVQLEKARHLRHTRQPREAEALLVELLADSSPDSMKQQALLELAMTAKEENELPRAQQIYAQFLSRWPNDALVPEILLRQGQLFRQMGLNNLALAKFYGVMTSALVVKNDTFDYYQRLVLIAQTEIAESYYQLGRYSESAEFFGRLLKQNNPALDRPTAQFRLVRSLAALGRNDETVAQGRDFLTRYSGRPEQPEVRFHLARALKQLGRNNDALQQVLMLLQEEKALTKEHPELWAYWQQRAGNEIGNQLYREGDYTQALGVYLTLAQLDNQPSWRLPVDYQIGLTYEKLSQPEKALQIYQGIIGHESQAGTNLSPGLKAIFEMARWRVDFIQWQSHAETQAHPPASPAPAEAGAGGSSSSRQPVAPKHQACLEPAPGMSHSMEFAPWTFPPNSKKI
jgi:tetratricopeptide (TPR) repeat protein